MSVETNTRIIPKGCRNNGVRHTSDNVRRVRSEGLNVFDEDPSKYITDINVTFSGKERMSR